MAKDQVVTVNVKASISPELDNLLERLERFSGHEPIWPLIKHNRLLIAICVVSGMMGAVGVLLAGLAW